MAKGKYHDWLTEDGLLLLEGWARDGITDEQIATKKMHISYSTFKEWMKKYPAISAAIKRGKAPVDYEVENVLLDKARSGDITAIIFWLKNRRPDKWRDKPDAVAVADPVRIVWGRDADQAL